MTLPERKNFTDVIERGVTTLLNTMQPGGMPPAPFANHDAQTREWLMTQAGYPAGESGTPEFILFEHLRAWIMGAFTARTAVVIDAEPDPVERVEPPVGWVEPPVGWVFQPGPIGEQREQDQQTLLLQEIRDLLNNLRALVERLQR